MLLQTSYCLVYEFCFVCHLRNCKSRTNLNLAHFRIVRKLFSKIDSCFCDVDLCLSSKALYPWTTKHNRWVWGLHVRFSENFFETQGQNARIYNSCWTTKLLSAWGPDFFVYPHFQKSKNTRLVSHEHLTKKLRNCVFCHQKWGVDLYMGSTYTRVNTVFKNIYMYAD